MRIDLHAHSSVSDGTERPAALVAAAAAAGLQIRSMVKAVSAPENGTRQSS